MTDSEIKALADNKDLIEALGYVDHILEEEGYETWCEARCTIARAKAALSGTERVECYLPVKLAESDITTRDLDGRVLCLKKTVLTVVNPSKS